MSNERFQILFSRLTNGTLSPAEEEELSRLWSDPAYSHLARQLLDEWYDKVPVSELQDAANVDRLYEQIMKQNIPVPQENLPVRTETGVVKPLTVLRRWGWAAAALLAVTTYMIWPAREKKVEVASTSASQAKDVAPGKNGAVLTLNDGSQVVLDSLANGIIARQNGTQLVLQNGQLTYAPNEKGPTASIAYNTMSTPKGRQFKLTLPDGTLVWLNAGSSLRYPTEFAGSERKVEITGEAYFEVAKDAGRPFRVNVNNRAEVEVLGTHFNINAYEEEASLNTTLLEGAVQIRTPDAKVVLKPGQQAQVNRQPHIAVINHADVEKVMAWKNGLFNFQNASLPDVMHQLARWYDIEVVYEGPVPDIYFGGKMSRNISLSGVLKALRAANVQFRVEDGKRLIVHQ